MSPAEKALLEEYRVLAEKTFGPPRSPDEWDAITLERAAQVLRMRTSKPGNFWLAVLCKVLTSAATKIRNAQ
jgi:hypothetical protein